MSEKISKYNFANDELRSLETQYTESLRTGVANPSLSADLAQLTRAADEMGGAAGREETVLVVGDRPTKI